MPDALRFFADALFATSSEWDWSAGFQEFKRSPQRGGRGVLRTSVLTLHSYKIASLPGWADRGFFGVRSTGEPDRTPYNQFDFCVPECFVAFAEHS